VPKNLVIPDPLNTVIGINMDFTRVGAGAAGVRCTLSVPGDPEGAFSINLNALPAGDQTALVTIFNDMIAALKAARGYA
jgi:hypothetical protein